MPRPSGSRDSAGRFTYLGIRAHLTLKGDPRMAEVIATENVIVHDDVLGIDRQLIAGQPVPPDLVDAYTAKIGPSAAAQSPGGDLDGMTVEDLQTLADERGVTVEGTGKDGNVLKADLVQALSA